MIIGPGPIEMLTILALMAGPGAAGFMGLPPGDRDAKLPQTASADALVYVEWAERGPGKEGAKGIDGFAADPEIKRFINDVWHAIQTGVEQETVEGSPQQRVLGANIPPLVKLLLNRSGCLWAGFEKNALTKKPGPKKAPPKKAPPNGPPGGVGPGQMPSWFPLLQAGRVCLVINGGKDADTIAAHFTALVQLLPADKRTKDLHRQPIPLPEAPPGISLTLHRHGNYFILAFGKGTIEQAIAGLDGKSQGLAGNPRFKGAFKRVGYKRTANVFYVDIASGVETATAVLGKNVAEIIKTLGLETVDVLVTATGVVDGEIRSRSYLGTGGKTTGVLALFSGRAIKPADFAHVPADSDFVAAFSLNANSVLDAVRNIIAAADPVSKKRLDNIIQQFEKELGLKLEQDVLAAFGDVWVLHDSKSAGGLFLTSVVGSLEVKNHAKAVDVYSKLMDALELALPGDARAGRFGRRRSVHLKSRQFRNHTIYYINTVGQPVPFAPAFCLTKSHLLAAPHPQALKAHLRFLESKEASFAGRLGTDLPLPEGDMLSLSYFETKRLLYGVYALAPYFGQVIASMLQSEGIEIDIFALPSARAVLPYFGNAFSTSVRTEDGIVSEARNASPLPGFVAGMMMGTLPMLLFQARAVKMRGGAVPQVVPAQQKVNRNAGPEQPDAVSAVRPEETGKRRTVSLNARAKTNAP